MLIPRYVWCSWWLLGSGCTSEFAADSTSGIDDVNPGIELPADTAADSSGATMSRATTVSFADTAVEPSSQPGSLGPYTCPPGPFAKAPVEEGATAGVVVGIPPIDDFAENAATIILEGPVWMNDRLYLSQINAGSALNASPTRPPAAGADGGGVSAEPPPSRILSVTEGGDVSIVLEDAGTNGLALHNDGYLVGANHKDGAITRLSVGGETSFDLVSMYMGVRFNSPNDLTFGADGTLYFTDPDYQAPSPAPQSATRVYRVASGSASALPAIEGRRQPNGISFSPNRSTLYVSAPDGVLAYSVLPDGSLATPTPFAPGVVRNSDGMAVDCAGNLFTTSGQNVLIVDASGVEVGRIAVPGVQNVTNVAFGGADAQTIYITSLGTGSRVGLFSTRSSIPGMPF